LQTVESLTTATFHFAFFIGEIANYEGFRNV